MIDLGQRFQKIIETGVFKMKDLKEENKLEKDFSEVLSLIQRTRANTIKSINYELIKLYWNIGKYIKSKIESAKWGDKIVEELSNYIRYQNQNIKGFTKRNLYRMCKFYEVYPDEEFVTAVLTQISWTNNLLILSKSKSEEERKFYLDLTIKEKYTSRELERQIDSGFFERVLLSKNNLKIVKTKNKDISKVFQDTYVLDFLNLPESHSEKDLQKSIVMNLKEFILEFGKDFTFIGQEYRVQVGNNDYFIDLLFYHRGLNCLVAVELKIDDFKPEYLGKMNFYLEALDRDIKKENENPSVGIILCKSKDDEVVEFALNRSLSPALVSEYTTKLIPKSKLQKKLKDLF